MKTVTKKLRFFSKKSIINNSCTFFVANNCRLGGTTVGTRTCDKSGNRSDKVIWREGDRAIEQLGDWATGDRAIYDCQLSALYHLVLSPYRPIALTTSGNMQ